jgi:hypothetical protein
MYGLLLGCLTRSDRPRHGLIQIEAVALAQEPLLREARQT